MANITAKELRTGLKAILEKVSGGKTFTIIYNSKPVAKLVPIESQKTGNGARIAEFVKNLPYKSTKFSNDKRTIKELYHDLLINDKKHRYSPEQE